MRLVPLSNAVMATCAVVFLVGCSNDPDERSGEGSQDVILGETVPTPVLAGKPGTRGFVADVTPVNGGTMEQCKSGSPCGVFSFDFTAITSDPARKQALKDG